MCRPGWRNSSDSENDQSIYPAGYILTYRRIKIKTMGDSFMEITDIRVRKVAKDGKMKAVVSITLDSEFVVHDIKVIEGDKGLFIAMPSRRASDGEYRDIAHPINSGTRERIQRMILEEYAKAVQEPEELTE